VFNSDALPEGQPRLTRGKLILLGSLASTLIGVLFSQFSGEEADTKSGRKGRAAHVDAAPATTVATTTNPAPGGAAAPKKEARPFPEITQEETLKHDPFAVSEAFAKQLAPKTSSDGEDTPDAKQKQEDKKLHQTLRQQALNKLVDQGVSVVVRGEKGPAAAIGSRLVHEGDVIDGFRVERIDAEGVILKEAPLP
jgi:hypothetical protein